MADPRSGRRHMAAIAELKSRGEVQACWSRRSPRCAGTLYASAPKGHPRAITLGHYVALEDDPTQDPYDPANYGPECGACNYGDGARRTNRNRAKGVRRSGGPRDVSPRRRKYRNPRWSRDG